MHTDLHPLLWSTDTHSLYLHLQVKGHADDSLITEQFTHFPPISLIQIQQLFCLTVCGHWTAAPVYSLSVHLGCGYMLTKSASTGPNGYTHGEIAPIALGKPEAED